MLFQSFQFAAFFIVVFTLYVVLRHRWQNRMLLVASYIFYGSWDWRFLSLIAISTVTDYLCSLGIEASDEKRIRKRYVAVSVFVNLTLLGIFKYFDFFSTSFHTLFGRVGIEFDPILINVILPVGISFYTFQTMSYTIDVYRNKVPAARNFWDFSLYVSFFPQLVAGPIERGTRLLPQILKPRQLSWERGFQGAYFVLWGLFLKVVVADNLAKIVDPVYSATGAYEGINVLLATYAFSIQIYADFAGYSFMAIGLAKVMGIDLMENFRRPYFTKNISDFWRRWHISLSSWFRDYVFSPFYLYLARQPRLANLSIKTRHVIAFMVTILVTEYLLGFWHGAGWNYGFFGLYHGMLIAGYYFIRGLWDRMPTALQIFLTYHLACLGWLIFRSPSLDQASQMLKAIFVNFRAVDSSIAMQSALTLLALTSIPIGVQLFQEWKNDTLVVLKWPRLVRDAFFVLLVILIVAFGEFGGRPFIYFQF